MEGLDKINLSVDKIEHLPLFFKTIYYNQITDIAEEMKLFKYNSLLQCLYMRDYYSNRRICKTVDFSIFNKETINEKK
jgi:hypothetical protein